MSMVLQLFGNMSECVSDSDLLLKALKSSKKSPLTEVEVKLYHSRDNKVVVVVVVEVLVGVVVLPSSSSSSRSRSSLLSHKM